MNTGKVNKIRHLPESIETNSRCHEEFRNTVRTVIVCKILCQVLKDASSKAENDTNKKSVVVMKILKMYKLAYAPIEDRAV